MYSTRQDALKNGEELYFTGKPCNKGHICERYTSNWCCRQCQIDTTKTEEFRKKQKIYDQNNREIRRKHFINSYHRHIDKNRARARNIKKQKRADKQFCIDEKIHIGIRRQFTRLKHGKKIHKKKKDWENLVDFTLEEVIKHMESQFDEHMSWENYTDYWWIDHIKPKSKCNSIEEVWQLDNLQPLEAKTNRIKSNKYQER